MFKRGRFFCFATVFFVLCLMSVSWGEERASRNLVPDENAAVTPLVVTGAGKLQTAKFLANTNIVSNSSITSWVNAFSTSVNLTGSTQCVKLSFAGEMRILTGALTDFRASVRALIDGSVLNVNPNIGFMNVDLPVKGVFSLTGMNWWKCGLPVGSHTVQVQFGPFFAGDTASVRQRTLVIEYAQ